MIYTIAGGACIGCGTCEAVCPANAVRSTNDIYEILPDQCIGCGRCANLCPVSCIMAEEDA